MNRRYIRPVPDGDSDFEQVAPAIENGGGGGNDGDMRERLARLEATLVSLASKADIGELRADFERGQKENRAWMLATVLALFAGILGAGGLVLSATKPQTGQAPSAAPAPIILQLPAAPAPAAASPPPASTPQ